MLNYEELKPVVEMMARKYHAKAHMDYEDMCQDLWICMYEKKLDNLHHATVVLKNKCIDISRKSWKIDNMTDGGDPQVAFDTVADKKVDFSQMVIVDEMLKTLDERSYKYAVSIAYLSGCDYLEDKFLEIFDQLPDENKKMIEDWSKTYTDDIVFKAIVGLKTGSNSSSARSIKWKIYDEFRKFGFKNDKYESRKNGGKGYAEQFAF